MGNKYINFGSIDENIIGKNNYSLSVLENQVNKYIVRKEVAKEEKKSVRPIEIMYIGNHFHDSLLNPIIKCLNEKYPTIEYNLSLGKIPLSENRKNKFEKILKYEVDEFIKSYAVDNNNLFDIDLNSTNPLKMYLGGNISEKQFDLILCYFEHHHLMNWRFGAINLIKCLHRGGTFVFGEVDKELEFLDGNFKNQPSEALKPLYALLTQFDKARSKIHYWKPEISISNYKEMRYQIGRLFNSVDEVKTSDYKFEITKEELKDKIEGFKYFSAGLYKRKNSNPNEEELIDEKLLEDFKKGICDIPQEDFTFTYSLRSYIALDYNPDWLRSMTSRKWNLSSIFKDIEDISQNTEDEFMPKALDVLANHDFIIPEMTNYMAIVEWKEMENTNWKFPLSFLVNEKLIRKNDDGELRITAQKRRKEIEKWIHYERQIGISLVKSIFNKSENKSVIRFHVVNENNFNHKYLESYKPLQGRQEIKFQFKYDKKGNPKELNLFINLNLYKEQLIQQAKNYKDDNDYFLIQIKNNFSQNSLLTSNFLKEKEQVIIFKKISKITLEIDKNTEDKSDKNNIVEDEKKELLFKILGVNFVEEFDKLIKVVCYSNFERYFNKQDIGTEIYSLSFFPSVIYENNNEKKEQIGLGGVVLYEKELSFDNRDINNYEYAGYMARNRTLWDVTNLLFYKAGILNYVSKDYKAQARRAAIAAINSRNYAHIIGSHVMVHAASSYYKIGEHQKFLKYLNSRSDYITQLTSSFPSWTISAKLADEVLRKFLEQKILLDGIGSSEGINFSKNGNLKLNLYERQWMDQNNQISCKPSFILNSESVIDFSKLEKFENINGKFYCVVSKIGLEKVYVLHKDHTIKYYFTCGKWKLEVGDRIIVEGELKSNEIFGTIEYTSQLLPIIEKNAIVKDSKDVKINIPGGAAGFHSLYIILENILRNAAKHNIKTDVNGTIDLNIEVESRINKNKEEVYIFKVWTNTTNLFDKLNGFSFSNLENGIENVFNLPNILNSYLEEDIITPEGKYKTEHLGLSEIKISACFLSEIDFAYYKNEIPFKFLSEEINGIVRASQVWVNYNNRLIPHLGFRFAVKKPRECIIITDQNLGNQISEGIKIVKHHEAESFDAEINKNPRQTSKFNYNFCILDYKQDSNNNDECFVNLLNKCFVNNDKESFNKICDKIENFPFRILMINGIEIYKKLKDNISNQVDFANESIFIRSRICFLDGSHNLETLISGYKNDNSYIYNLWVKTFNAKLTNKIDTHFFDVNYSPSVVDLESDHPLNEIEKKNLARINELPPITEVINGKGSEIKFDSIDIKYIRHYRDFIIKENEIFADYVTHHQMSLPIFYDLLNEKTKSYTNFKLIESALNNIMIIDERVYKYLKENQEVYKRYLSNNIIIPYSIEVERDGNVTHLYQINFDVKDDFFKNDNLFVEREIIFTPIKMKYLIRKKYDKVHTLVFHFHIIDLFKNDIKKVNANVQIEDIIYNLKIDYKIPCLIITSGKGQNEASKKYAKFIPFASIQDFIINKHPDKLSLMNALYKTLK